MIETSSAVLAAGGIRGTGSPRVVVMGADDGMVKVISLSAGECVERGSQAAVKGIALFPLEKLLP